MIKHSFTQRICVEDLLYAGAVLGVEQGSICGTWWDTQFCRGDSHPLNNYINNANNVYKLIVKPQEVPQGTQCCEGRSQGFLT